MRLFLSAFLVVVPLLISASAASAQEWSAKNKHRVAPSTEQGASIEVYSRPAAAPSQYYCAAADYAKRWFNSHNSDRVMVVLPFAPSKTKPGSNSVHFTVVPYQTPRAKQQSLSIGVDRRGEDMTIVVALKKCEVRRGFGFP